MSQYGGYGNPYYGDSAKTSRQSGRGTAHLSDKCALFFHGDYPYDNQTPYYVYVQPDYVTGHAEGSGSSIHNIDKFQPPHGYPRIYPEYQSLYDISPSKSTPQSSYMQDHARSDDDHRNKRQSQDFVQSPHSEIQSLKGKERQYQDFKESLDYDKSRIKQTPLEDYEEIETDEDKILNPEVPTASPRRSGI
ncbi:hypothetical protein PPACK8108_LOCUS15343 [Phakopsora pachyrhizi]|uniref:Uncharacterized protein n=1 Tax=Phakopsora pachyrhizi TaxID=170000 RepID=A0AAV0B627_PHAPC|nr:hypothetical protein PPACK8108_LOCUS15343 [Phakopsora pachyrhizi]